MSSVAAKKGLNFVCEFGQGAQGCYRGDSARVRRILYSLSDNAVKFTQDGGVTLSVEREGERLVFSVADTGIGIGEDDLAHLFERFFQADATLTRPFAGAGVGLAICSDLASLMGGAITARSVVGEGSTFTLTLPLDPVAAAPRETIVPNSEEAAPAGALRVLAAEDNITNQLVLKALLGPLDIEPTIAGNGREALESWENEAWDIILMDIQMPEMNGIEAASAIRRRERETGRSRTPIIAVTANAMTHQVAEYHAAGMDGVVAKPVDLSTLIGVMEQALASDAHAASRGSQTPIAAL